MYKKLQTYRKYILLIISFVIVMVIWQIYSHSDTDVLEQPVVLTHNTSHWVNKTSKTVLIWTGFFFDDTWVDSFKNAFKLYKCKCIATADKSKIKSADAVVFHLHDIDSLIPDYRDESQVWIVTNAEPPPRVFTSRDLRRVNNMFNWTLTYRRDSTIHAFYGRFGPLSNKEQLKYTPINYAATKSKMAASIVSDCADNAERYRILQELARYINLHQYGSCGTLSCPRTGESKCRSSQYRFRIAFENSNCRDYITEKFWNTLKDNVIPVVNWPWLEETAMTELVPPKSFINLHDFETVADLGKYLNYLTHNDAEFNSYFEWKKHYRLLMSVPFSSIDLCTKLHQLQKDQEITDLHRWLQNDTSTCKPISVFSSLRIYLELFFSGKGW
ncbi:glycoprotein 3-alpha-L-fucosyltransferase A-like [Mizuhopecten yessoensis]|uniref:glycoprotein 3-alpha-L-fucosyltransferase A-like n=1 Tax=Mizuhopecten yessoensis TaxID=6573 RepID=UPI000B45A701|nr:glycoprotein 3-alpha-L-fucosyltransferase A-like [Mizuhopecten yessoensis]